MQRSRKRRFIPAIIILVVGGLVAWWASQRENARIDAIDRYVRSLCISASQGDDVRGRIVAEPLVRDAVATRLALVFGSSSDTLDEVDIAVAPGDVGGFGATIASHRATISLGDDAVLGLRLDFDDDSERISVLGYWEP